MQGGGYSRNSRNNEIFDFDEKAYQSYFNKDKDIESFDADPKYGYSKHKESLDIDEKFHGLLRHRGSFDVDHKDYNRFQSL